MITDFKKDLKEIVKDYMRENNITMSSSDYDFRTMGDELKDMIDWAIIEVMNGRL